MPKVTKKRGRPPIPKPTEGEKIQCLCCGDKKVDNFYKSNNPFNRFFGVIPYCKDCIKGKMWDYYLLKFDKNEQMALHALLLSLNLPYIHSVYLASTKNLANPNAKINNVNAEVSKDDTKVDRNNSNILISAYMKNYNSLHDRNNYGDIYLDSEGLDNIENLVTFEDIIKVKYKKNNNVIGSNDTEIIEYDSEYLIQKFGLFPPEDLAFLEEQYLQWKDKLGKFIYEKSTEMNVIMLCIEFLKIRKKNQTGDKTKEEIDTIQKIMAMSGLNEKQSMNDKNTLVIGMEAKEIENHRPIRPASTNLDDVDGFKKQILGYVGASSRAWNKDNQYVKAFDDIMGDYSLDIFNKPTEEIAEAIEDE